jgi:hypothetical protein
MGVGAQRHTPAALPPEKDLVPILQQAEWAPGQAWTGAKNLAATSIRSPDLTAHCESLHRLSFRVHSNHYEQPKKFQKHYDRWLWNSQCGEYVYSTLRSDADQVW